MDDIKELIENCSCYVFFGKDLLLIYDKNMELSGKFTVTEEQMYEIRKIGIGLESKPGR
jgi:hypothetical protein